MTISTPVSRADFVGNGIWSIASMPSGFRIFAAADLIVIREDLNGALTVLVLTTDYTVQGVGIISTGVTVTLPAPLTDQYKLHVRRVLDLLQATDIRNQGAFFPEIHEDEFDRLTMLNQQIAEAVGRALQFKVTSTMKDKFVEDLIASKFLQVKSDSSGIQMVDGVPGVQGPQGPAGVNGTNGTNGTNGADGAPGGVGVLNQTAVDVTVGNVTTETTVYTFSIPANTLGTSKLLRLILHNTAKQHVAGTGTITWRLKYGATTLITAAGYDPNSTAAISSRYTFEVMGHAATNIQLGNFFDGGSTARGTAAEDSTAAKTLSITAEWSTTGGANQLITMEHATLEIVKP